MSSPEVATWMKRCSCTNKRMSYSRSRLLFNVAHLSGSRIGATTRFLRISSSLDVAKPMSEQRSKGLSEAVQSYLDRQNKQSRGVIPITFPRPEREVEPPLFMIESVKPLHTKWWFWLTIGSVAAAGITTGSSWVDGPQTFPVAMRIEPSNTLHFEF